MSDHTPAATAAPRDRFSLRRDQLLADYAAKSQKRRGAAETTALRLRSRQYLAILAFEASSGKLDWNELRSVLLSPSMLGGFDLNPMVLAEIGRVLLLQNFEDEDTKLGIVALEHGVTKLPRNVKSRRFRKLLVDHYILNHEYSRAHSLLDKWPDVATTHRKYLRAELSNPFFVSDGGDQQKWLSNFNHDFVAHGLAAIKLVGDAEPAFDRLGTETVAKGGVGDETGPQPKVSVIVTTFEPSGPELLTSVRSILAQTYRNIEVIVVDDASAPEYQEVIASVCSIDSRIRLVSAEENQGTYCARNIGLSVATGVYVTGQDDDDWSHPERLVEQVSFLQETPNAVGCRVASVACLDNLSRVRLGYTPLSANASSLMMKRDTFRRIGGFVRARKAADTELHRRAEQVTGLSVLDIDKPLAIVRIESGSLSRSDFRAGWSHPARREFKFSYSYWHARAPQEALELQSSNLPQLNVPRRFRVDMQSFPSHFDVVFAGDWRQYGGPQKSMLEEISALTARGLSIGVMQLEAPRFMSKIQKPLTWHVQQLINDGTVTAVLYDDPVDVDLFILRYPPILQFAPVEPSALRIRRMLILANQAPSELDGSDVRYLVPDCTRNAHVMFCDDVLWVPQGPQVRSAIEPYLDAEELAAYDIPGTVNPDEWYRDHRYRRSTLPVVGRHSRDNVMKWPEEPTTVEAVYPTSGRFDVRVLGGAKVVQAVLGDDVSPAGWSVYETDSLPVQSFLETLDFYVFYQNSIAVEAFGRAILEAIASGLVVILPLHYREVFGESAIYAEPSEVQTVVMRYHNDRDLYMRQVRVAQSIVYERFSHHAYGDLIDEVLESVRI